MGAVAKLFAGLGIAVAFLLVFGFVVALTAYEEAKPYVEREYPSQLFSERDRCDAPCARPSLADTFRVEPWMNRVHLSVDVSFHDGAGAVQLTVRDPSGDVRYERLFAADAARTQQTDYAVWTAEAGDWTIARTLAGAGTSLHLDVWGQGLPTGTL